MSKIAKKQCGQCIHCTPVPGKSNRGLCSYLREALAGDATDTPLTCADGVEVFTDRDIPDNFDCDMQLTDAALRELYDQDFVVPYATIDQLDRLHATLARERGEDYDINAGIVETGMDRLTVERMSSGHRAWG